MDFIDWRKAPEETVKADGQTPEKAGRWRNKRYVDYIEELIQEAQERGEFSNLPGAGKPLNLDESPYAGDQALAYHLLKNNGLAPSEVELSKEIRQERERAQAKLNKVIQQGKALRARRVAAFPSEKRAFNNAATNALSDYDRTLRELNRKILTLNLTAPAAMHQTLLEVERLVQEAHASCPLFEEDR